MIVVGLRVKFFLIKNLTKLNLMIEMMSAKAFSDENDRKAW